MKKSDWQGKRKEEDMIPKSPIVVTPAEMVAILKDSNRDK
jgi:hypothetical protein